MSEMDFNLLPENKRVGKSKAQKLMAIAKIFDLYKEGKIDVGFVMEKFAPERGVYIIAPPKTIEELFRENPIIDDGDFKSKEPTKIT